MSETGARVGTVVIAGAPLLVELAGAPADAAGAVGTVGGWVELVGVRLELSPVAF